MDKASCKYCDKKLENLEKDKYSVLLGNGILSANDDLKKNFDSDFFKDAFNKISDNLNENYKKYLTSISCPEVFLNIFRVEISCEILRKYDDIYNKFKNNTNYGINLASKYLRNFRNLFTINYDCITYHAIVAASEKNYFQDGLIKNNNPHDIKTIEYCIDYANHQKRKPNRGSYFLHGAFHILQYIENDRDTYLKLSTKIDETITTKVNELILNGFRESIQKKNDTLNKFDLTTVIETRPQNKLAWIQNDPYLSFCLERLCEQENILTLGCSFSNDDHILESLMLSKNVKELIVGVFSSSDIKNVHSAIGRLKRKHSIDSKKLKEDYGKLSFVCTQKLGKIIWNSNHPNECKKINLSPEDFDEL